MAANSTGIAGQGTTFTVIVTDAAGSGAPTGNVELFDGSTNLGAASVMRVNGESATYSITTWGLSPGMHSIQAEFSGSGNFLASGGVLSEKIVAATTTVVTSNHVTANRGLAVTFTATVTDTSGGELPTGRIAFYDGSIYLGSASLMHGSGGSATATLTTSRLPAGDDTIVAVFTATGDLLGSRGVLDQVVAAVHGGKATPRGAATVAQTTAIDRIFGEIGRAAMGGRQQ
jgi:hypothetical protein